MTGAQKGTNWYQGEKLIHQEMEWLSNSIDVFLGNEKNAPITCKECLLRKIAILIVSGEVQATEIVKSPPLRSFWKKGKEKIRKPIHHGKEWHRNTMAQVEQHFLSQKYDVRREPSLLWGRADLGAYKHGEQGILIEVGTTSFFKIWINLEKTHNFTYLIVPDDERIIEFIRL